MACFAIHPHKWKPDAVYHHTGTVYIISFVLISVFRACAAQTVAYTSHLYSSVFISPTASQGKCLVWRNPIWLRLLLLPLIVLALIPSIKENIGFGPAQVSGKGDQSVGSNHSWVCVYTVGMSSTYVGTYTRICASPHPHLSACIQNSECVLVYASAKPTVA